MLGRPVRSADLLLWQELKTSPTQTEKPDVLSSARLPLHNRTSQATEASALDWDSPWRPKAPKHR